jgi:hypothetical protein
VRARVARDAGQRVLERARRVLRGVPDGVGRELGDGPLVLGLLRQRPLGAPPPAALGEQRADERRLRGHDA